MDLQKCKDLRAETKKTAQKSSRRMLELQKIVCDHCWSAHKDHCDDEQSD